MFVLVQVHQELADHHKRAAQHVSRVVQQPMSHQPTAIHHHHMQQLAPLAQQLSMAKDGSCAHVAEPPLEVCFAATAPGQLSGTPGALAVSAAETAAATVATAAAGTMPVQPSEHPVCKTEASLAEGSIAAAAAAVPKRLRIQPSPKVKQARVMSAEGLGGAAVTTITTSPSPVVSMSFPMPCKSESLSATGTAATSCKQESLLATGTTAPEAGMAVIRLVAACAVPLQVHCPSAGVRDNPNMSATGLHSPIMYNPPTPSSCDAVVQQKQERMHWLLQPSPVATILPGMQAPILPGGTPPSGLLQGYPPASLVPVLATNSLSASVGMPSSIVQLVAMVNNQMGPQQLRHHNTEAQAMHLEEVFGDVKVLLELAGMEDKPLNSILRSDGKLNALQIVSMRRFLRIVMPTSAP